MGKFAELIQHMKMNELMDHGYTELATASKKRVEHHADYFAAHLPDGKWMMRIEPFDPMNTHPDGHVLFIWRVE